MAGIGWTHVTTAGLAFALALPALAQDAERVRGVVEAVEADRVTIRTRDGDVQEYPLSPEVRMFVVRPADLDDVAEGAFVGITSVERDGRRVALETHVFTEELRGAGEGHFPWDLVEQPNTMTNATVAEVKGTPEQRQITVTYAESPDAKEATGSQTITLPPDAPIVQLAETDRRDLLQPGRAVFVWVEIPEDGTAAATMVVVGEAGTVPPM